MSNARTCGSRGWEFDVLFKKARNSFLHVPAIRVLVRISSAVRGVSRVLPPLLERFLEAAVQVEVYPGLRSCVSLQQFET